VTAIRIMRTNSRDSNHRVPAAPGLLQPYQPPLP